MHCVIEVMGHVTIAGKVTEQAIAGQGFIRIEVPKTSKRDGFTRFYGPGVIYSMTPVSEEIARLMAERLEVEAVSEWQLSQALKSLLPSTAGGNGDRVAFEDDDESWASDFEDDDEDDDSPFFGDMPDVEEPNDDDEPGVVGLVEMVLGQVSAADSVSDLGGLQDKRLAAQWARDLLTTDFVIFDTETTGVEFDDEIIQIGIIDQTGAVILEQLIKPTRPITNTVYHGLTDDHVKDAPGFPAVYEQIKAALQYKVLVSYNYEYDARMLAQVCIKHGLDVPTRENAYCAMNQYAQFNGEWNDYHGNYRWVKLREALAAFGLKHTAFGTKEHDACTDARATLAVIRKMAEFEAEKSAATE